MIGLEMQAMVRAMTMVVVGIVSTQGPQVRGKFICDVLNAQVLKGYGCKLFAYRKEEKE